MAIGELFHIFKTGHSRILDDKTATTLNRMLNDTDQHLGRRLIYVDALLASYLADPDARAHEYLYTRAIAHAILRKLDLIEAFFYPSVCQECGINLPFPVRPTNAKCVLRRRRSLRLFGIET